MQRTNGFINVGESVGYVSQQAWIRNMSLKRNILFGKSLSERTYEQVVSCCALTDDLGKLLFT